MNVTLRCFKTSNLCSAFFGALDLCTAVKMSSDFYLIDLTEPVVKSSVFMPLKCDSNKIHDLLG